MTLSPDLIVRPYNEIVDDVLVALVGGVVNEHQTFDIRELAYPLAERAASVRGITGTSGGLHYNFLPNVDWRYDPAQNAIVWLEKGAKPDANDPVFYVDYFRRSGPPSPLTDINIGSVTRTLAEAMSRELAVLYQQVNLAYQSGFIDTATGKSLDFVVGILGITRLTADFATGLVSFTRTATSKGNITIPEGTLLITQKGVTFETTSERTLQRGQVRIDVPARASAAFIGPLGLVQAHEISTLVIPIEGIDQVTNFDPMTRGAADETDDELRARAKAVLRGLSQCTIDALTRAAVESRAGNIEIMDPMYPPDQPGVDNSAKRTSPGNVAIIVEVEPARYDNVVSAVTASKAAGINLRFIARYVFIELRLSVSLRRDISPAGKDQLKLDIIQALKDFAASQGSGKPLPAKGKLNPDTLKIDNPGLLDMINAVPDVKDATAADLLVWRTVVEDGSQLGQRKPAPELVQTPAGTQASGDDIKAGNFVVKIEDKWWPVIDMDPADIQLTGPA